MGITLCASAVGATGSFFSSAPPAVFVGSVPGTGTPAVAVTVVGGVSITLSVIDAPSVALVV